MFRDDIGIINLILISLLLLLEAEDVDNVVLVLDDEIHKVTVVIIVHTTGRVWQWKC